jgi:hypothetical protein
MRPTGMRLLTALGVLLGVCPPAVTGAQTGPANGRDPAPARAGAWAADPDLAPRGALSGFYTRIGFGGGTRAGGVGARLTWALAPAGASSWLGRHAAVGVFGAYTPEQRLGFSTAQLGAAVDVTPAPLGALAGGRLEPFVSLGAGALRTNAHVAPRRPAAGAHPRTAGGPREGAVPGTAPGGAVPAVPRTGTAFMLVPAAGVRVHVRPGVAAEADVRNVVTFGDGARRHPALGTGVRLAF